MSLHRASGLVTFFAVVLFSGYLWDAIERRHLVAALLAAWTVAMLVMTGPGVCVLPPLALLGADVLRRYGDAPNKVPLALFWALALCVVLVAWVNVACTLWDASPLHAVGDRLWKPLRLLNPLLDDDLLLRGGRFHRTLGVWAALGAAVLLAAGGRVPYMRWLVPVLCVAGVLANHAIRSGNWLVNYGHDARRLLEVQRWAHETTAPDALFIVDPTRNYGWRDYAERSCFGFYREWGFFAFMYDADETLYEEGRRRLALFGADMDEIATRHLAAGTPMHRVKLEVQEIVSEGFRATTSGGWLEIAGAYGADYLVCPVPAEGPPGLDLPVAFENDAYIVFSLNPGE